PTCRPLPDLAHELATQAGFTCFAVGHHAARGGDDRGAHAAHHAGDGVLVHVTTAARRAHAPDAGDHAGVVTGVLEVDAEDALLLVLDQLVVVHVALAQQN